MTVFRESDWEVQERFVLRVSTALINHFGRLENVTSTSAIYQYLYHSVCAWTISISIYHFAIVCSLRYPSQFRSINRSNNHCYFLTSKHHFAHWQVQGSVVAVQQQPKSSCFEMGQAMYMWTRSQKPILH